MKTCRIKVAFTAAALAALCASPAIAQTADSASGSNSNSTSGAQSGAGAVAGANNSTSNSNSTSSSGAVAGAGAQSSADNSSGATAKQNLEVGVTLNQPSNPAETTSTIRQEIHNSGSLKTAPGFFTPAPASGPCTGLSGGATGSWLGGGFGVSLATVDASCTIRENLRVLTAIAPLLAGDEQKAYAGQLVMDLLAAMRANMPSAPAAK